MYAQHCPYRVGRREYDHNPKSADWYWVLGIIAVAGAVASILFSNYLLAALIVIAAAGVRSPRFQTAAATSLSSGGTRNHHRR